MEVDPVKILVKETQVHCPVRRGIPGDAAQCLDEVVEVAPCQPKSSLLENSLDIPLVLLHSLNRRYDPLDPELANEQVDCHVLQEKMFPEDQCSELE